MGDKAKMADEHLEIHWLFRVQWQYIFEGISNIWKGYFVPYEKHNLIWPRPQNLNYNVLYFYIHIYWITLAPSSEPTLHCVLVIEFFYINLNFIIFYNFC